LIDKYAFAQPSLEVPSPLIPSAVEHAVVAIHCGMLVEGYDISIESKFVYFFLEKIVRIKMCSCCAWSLQSWLVKMCF